MSWFYHHHFTVQWPEFAISELLFQIPFFTNCRPGPFFVANFVIPYHFFLQFFQIVVLDFFANFGSCVSRSIFSNFSNCCPGSFIANFWNCRSRSLILQIVKNSLDPKTKNKLIFELFFVKEMTVLKRVCDRKEEQVENIATFFFLLTSLRRWDDQRWWWRYMRKLFLLIIYITWCAVFHVGCGTRFTWRTAQCLHDNLNSTKDYLTIPLLPLTFNGCRQLAWYNILSLSKFVENSNEGKELHPEL